MESVWQLMFLLQRSHWIFFEKLDVLVIENDGVANLSKDSRLSADVASRMFPNYEIFKQKLNAYDPEKRFTSSLRVRLDV